MKTSMSTKMIALALAIVLPFTSAAAMATEMDANNDVTVMDAVEALYEFDGEPQMVDEYHVDSQAENTYVTYKTDAADWAVTYDILPENVNLNANLTRNTMAELLYNYAQYNDVDVSAYDSALGWATDNGIIANGVVGNHSVDNNEFATTLSNYQDVQLPSVGVIANGLTLTYPTENMKRISPLCGFYVIGDIDSSVEVPADAKLTIRLATYYEDTVVREVSTNIKNNWAGMNINSPDVVISTNREEFRHSMMPDLVYDPADPSSYENTWIKACYSDEHYTGLIYGGTYTDNINPYDQFGNLMGPIPEGNYRMTITLTDADNDELASLATRITIGVIPKKIIVRSSPTSYFVKARQYAENLFYVLFTDPYPGAWNTNIFLPRWGVNYVASNDIRWRLTDRLGYVGGMTYFFDYNVTPTSTSYSVELGQIGYDNKLEDPDSMTYIYLDIGEPEIRQQGRVYEGNFVQVPVQYVDSLIFTRADHSTIATPENTISPAILNETTSEFDMPGFFTVSAGEIVSLNGICKVIQPETVTLNSNETFTMGNKIASVRYTLRDATGTVYGEVTKPVGLTREFGDGSSSYCLLEFRHNFTVDSTWSGQIMRIFAQALDENGNEVGGSLLGCQFMVSRS